MSVIIEDLDLVRDERGSVFEPLGPERVSAQRNVHVVLTEPRAIRGNHFHREATEVLAVVGPALVRFRDRQEMRDATVSPGQVVRFTIPPGVSHAVQNIGDEPALLVAFRDRPYDPGNADVWPDVLITAAPRGDRERASPP